MSQPADLLGRPLPSSPGDDGGDVYVGGDADNPTFVVLPHRHLADATAMATTVLRAAGLDDGDVVVVLGTLTQSAVLRPFAQACNDIGAPYVAGQVGRFGRGNLLEFFPQFRPKLVLGLDVDVVTAIQQAGWTVDDAFPGATIFATRAAQRLIPATPRIRDWIALGPGVAAGCEAGRGGHLVTGAWRPVIVDGALRLVTDQPGESIATGITGTLAEGTCSCDVALPRFLPAGTEVDG